MTPREKVADQNTAARQAQGDAVLGDHTQPQPFFVEVSVIAVPGSLANDDFGILQTLANFTALRFTSSGLAPRTWRLLRVEFLLLLQPPENGRIYSQCHLILVSPT